MDASGDLRVRSLQLFRFYFAVDGLTSLGNTYEAKLFQECIQITTLAITPPRHEFKKQFPNETNSDREPGQR